MPFPARFNLFVRNGTLYVFAAIIFWGSVIPLMLFTSLRWVAALDFVAGLIFLLLWQTWGGEKSISN